MPYLSREAYLLRFGEPETIRVTDEARAGAIDAPKVDAALADASLIIDGYVANSYDLPIDPVPPVLDRICGDLAREMLHRTRPVEAVTLAADRARSMLKDIGAGRMKLPVTGGGVAEPAAPTGLASWGQAADARIFSADKLAGF